MIWIIGGTSESRELLAKIKDKNNFVMTIATEDGLDFFDSDRVIVGRLSKEEMIDFIKTYNIDRIIDLSHPYAKIVTENAKAISKEMGISYIRYIREKIKLEKNEIYLDSYEEAYRYLKEIKGRVFFTTGSKNIKDFQKVRGDNRYIYRVLPALESLEICKNNKIHMRDIVACLGPFSKELNKAMLKEYSVDYCLMKDSGNAGGTMEKILACRELNITPIIIGREEEEGIRDLDDIYKFLNIEK